MKFDKNKLPSRHVSIGPERAPHRSYYYAMGLSEEDINRYCKPDGIFMKSLLFFSNKSRRIPPVVIPQIYAPLSLAL